MGLTNFPNGITSFGIPVMGTVDSTVIAGDVYFVGATAGANWIAGVNDPAYGTNIAPFATIKYAISQCTANNGDVIYVLPGHTETIASAGALTINVAGISIIGLGNGSLRPTLTWSATASSVLITAANVTIKNFITKVSIDEVVSMFSVSAAGVTLDAIDFIEYGALGATGQAIQFLLTTAAANDLTIKNCKHTQQTAAASAQGWIELVGTSNTRILNNTINLLAKASTASSAILGSTAVINCEIVGNRINFAGATITMVINMVSTSTGFITDNRVFGGANTLLAAIITASSCFVAENYCANTVAASGIVAPAVDVIT